MPLRLIVSLLILLPGALLANPRDSSSIIKRVYTTQPIAQAPSPIIDGQLDDEAWQSIDWSSDFTQNAPDEGAKPTFQTRFKILYDDKHLYVAYHCLDDVPDKIEKRLSRRDGFAGDWIEINIDSYNDKRTGFSFTISAAGVKGDEFISENGDNWDGSWNPIWYAGTKIDDTGWTAEIKIPFSQLRFGNAQEQVWGFQVTRRLFRKEERSVWQRVPQDAPGWVSEFAELRGLKNIQPQRQLEIQPFALLQHDQYQAEAGNPFRDGSDTRFNAGLDAKIGITNDLTLDLTINPDFGQVDADPGAIALDGFQIFFEERRPFFVENKNIFDFQFANNSDNIFYSRRIGRSPQLSADLQAGEFENTPINSSIIGAAKFSGKTKNGWSIGLLESMTAREYTEIDNNGEKRRELIEPQTNYVIARTQKDFNNRNSFIGAIFTATNRDLTPELMALRASAYTAGIDFMHSWKKRNYYVLGNIVSSRVNGSKEAITNTQKELTHLFQREDASHVAIDTNATNLSGTGGKVEIGKSGGGNWRYKSGLIWRSPQLELNDVGFLRQADEIRQYSQISRLFLEPTDWYRRININFNQLSTYDFEGNYNRLQLDINTFINFQNNWWVEIGAAHKPRIFTNTFLRGGPRWAFSQENYFYTYVGSDSRKRFQIVLGQVFSRSQENNFAFYNYETRIAYQPTNALNISLSINFEDSPNQTQYVDEVSLQDTKRYIVSSIDQKTLSTSLRINYSINPNLTIQYYGQPFVARGRYNNFKYVKDADEVRLNQRVQLFQSDHVQLMDGSYRIFDAALKREYDINNPDFSYVQYRGNLVVRWEYIPGSELFLVWSQATTGNADPTVSLLEGLQSQVLNKPLEHIFMLKATYRFVL